MMLIAVRFALYADLMLLFGIPLFALYAPHGPEGRSLASFRFLLLALVVTAVPLAAAGLLLVSAGMAGTTVVGLDRATVTLVVMQTPIGIAWQVRMAALGVALLGTVAPRRSGGFAATSGIAAAGGVALASLAWTGHGAAGEGSIGTLQLSADIVHLLAAGTWLGAIAALCAMLFARDLAASPDGVRIAARALACFAVTGTLAVAAITATGIVNSYVLVGLEHAPNFGVFLYDRLLTAKLVLFGAMLALAAANRFRLTPALDRAADAPSRRAAVRALRRSLAVEAAAAIAVLALVAWLGTIEPPMGS